MALKLPQFTKPNINKTQLSRILAATAAVIGLVLLAGAVANSYQEKQKIQITQQNAQLQAREAQLTQLRTENQQWKQAYNDQRVSCEKGSNIYNGILTPFQKKSIKAENVPKCGLAVPSFSRN